MPTYDIFGNAIYSKEELKEIKEKEAAKAKAKAEAEAKEKEEQKKFIEFKNSETKMLEELLQYLENVSEDIEPKEKIEALNEEDLEDGEEIEEE